MTKSSSRSGNNGSSHSKASISGGYNRAIFGTTSQNDSNNHIGTDNDDMLVSENSPIEPTILESDHSLSHLNETIMNEVFKYLKPRDLLTLVTCCKQAPRIPLVTMDQCISVVLNSGPCGVKSLININKLMVNRSIYPVSIARLLRIGCGVKCEFCVQNEVRITRPQWGVNVCWKCLSNNTNDEQEDNTDTWNINRLWNRTFIRWGGKHFVKAYYLAHRAAIFKTFNDPQVLAYCYGMRPVESSYFVGRMVNSMDRYEIMYRTLTRDHSNVLIGPRFSFDMMREIVQFLEQDDSRTVEQFLSDMKDAPLDTDYDQFTDSFQNRIEEATSNQIVRSRNIEHMKYISRLMKIERVLEALHQVALFLTVETLNSPQLLVEASQWQQIFARLPVTQYTVNALHRLMLCYREEHHLLMKSCISFDTGDHDVNVRLMHFFQSLIQAPSKVTKKEARITAMYMWLEFEQDVNRRRNVIPALCAEANDNEFNQPVLRTSFADQWWMKPKFRPRTTSFKWKHRPWKDTSKNRRY